MELIIVLIIIAICAAYWIQRLRRTFGKDAANNCGGDCGCACSSQQNCETTDTKTVQIIK